MRGRKPKPSALKLLDGNPGKHEIPNDPKPAGRAEAPHYLSVEAQKHWYQHAKALNDCEILTAVDATVFAMLCEQYALWREAEGHVLEDGRVKTSAKGYQYKSAWETIRGKAVLDYLRLAVEFGLTPSSRSRISVRGKNDFDDFEKL